MATIVTGCGFECGCGAFNNSTHLRPQATSAGYSTSIVRSGLRAGRINPSATFSYFNVSPTASRIWIYRIYVYFATFPDATCSILTDGDKEGAWFNSADNKIYAGWRDVTTPTLGTTGVTVTTGRWYKIDVKVLRPSASHTVDVKVDGNDCSQIAFTSVDASINEIVVGSDVINITCDIYFDDFVASNTEADFPIRPSYFNVFLPTADGAHNVAGANDFERSATGVDITNATTDAFQLINDLPIKTGTPTEYINMIAPPNATDYVEVIFGPAAGVNTPTAAPIGIEAIVAHASTATGTNNIRAAVNDNGTLDDIANGAYHIGTAVTAYHSKYYVDPPSAASLWTLTSGNGNFNNIRMRFFTSDAAPDPWIASAMIEAEFAEVPQKIVNINQAVKRAAYY